MGRRRAPRGAQPAITILFPCDERRAQTTARHRPPQDTYTGNRKKPYGLLVFGRNDDADHKAQSRDLDADQDDDPPKTHDILH